MRESRNLPAPVRIQSEGGTDDPPQPGPQRSGTAHPDISEALLEEYGRQCGGGNRLECSLLGGVERHLCLCSSYARPGSTTRTPAEVGSVAQPRTFLMPLLTCSKRGKPYVWLPDGILVQGHWICGFVHQMMCELGNAIRGSTRRVNELWIGARRDYQVRCPSRRNRLSAPRDRVIRYSKRSGR